MAWARNIEPVDGGEYGDDNTAHGAAGRGAGDNHPGDAVCARRARRREADGRVLGPLGSRRECPARKAVPGMGRKGKNRHQGRLHHLQRRQGSVDRRRRGTVPLRTRHSRHAGVVRAGLRRQPRAGRRRHGSADPAARCGQRRRRIPWQAGRALGRGADRGRQHRVAALCADRPDEGVLRARRHQDVSGRRAARQGTDGRLELGLFHASGGEMLQGRLCVRDADELVQRRDADDRRAVQQLRRAAGQRQGRHHRQQRPGEGRARMGEKDGAVLSAQRLRLGRFLEQQGADLGAERADLQRPVGVGGSQARRTQGYGPSRPRKGRRAVTSPAATAIGASGSSRPTRRRRRTCCCTCRRATRWQS